jgi:hypothetical protein
MVNQQFFSISVAAFRSGILLLILTLRKLQVKSIDLTLFEWIQHLDFSTFLLKLRNDERHSFLSFTYVKAKIYGGNYKT